MLGRGVATGPQPLGGTGTVRIGIVGCGAIAETAHLPAVLSSRAVALTALSDINLARLRYLQRQYGLGPIGFRDYREAMPHVDAVILALPNNLHASVGVELLSQGIHVLCEKPLALSRDEGEQLCQAARAARAVLAVGFVTRFFPSTELTKQLIESGLLGEVKSFDYEFGTPGGWAALSGYTLARSTSGGGVLVVSGSHFLDRMIYLFGEVEVISHADDSRGGVEANCTTWFAARVQGRPLHGRVLLSKTHQLANRLRIVGANGALEIKEGQTRSVTYVPSEGGVRHDITAVGTPPAEMEPNYAQLQLQDFVHAIQTGAAPKVDGQQGCKSVALAERCYAVAKPLPEPWCEATLERLSRAVTPASANPAPPELSLAGPDSP